MMRTSEKPPKNPLRTKKDPRHGTLQAYRYWGCRCQKCRVYYSEYQREVREKAEIYTHGTTNSYQLGCRCTKCRRAQAESSRVRNTRMSSYKKEHQPRGEVTRVQLNKLA